MKQCQVELGELGLIWIGHLPQIAPCSLRDANKTHNSKFRNNIMLQTDRNRCVISVIYVVVWRCCRSHLNDPRRKQESGSFLSRLGPVLTPFRSLPIYHLISASIALSLSLHPFLSPPLNGRLSSYQSFLDILNEMNDYAGQRELIAENMMMNICIDLTKYLQELKQERKTVGMKRSRSVLGWVV